LLARRQDLDDWPDVRRKVVRAADQRFDRLSFFGDFLAILASFFGDFQKFSWTKGFN
jgi:hypothetical protein